MYFDNVFHLKIDWLFSYFLALFYPGCKNRQLKFGFGTLRSISNDISHFLINQMSLLEQSIRESTAHPYIYQVPYQNSTYLFSYYNPYSHSHIHSIFKSKASTYSADACTHAKNNFGTRTQMHFHVSLEYWQINHHHHHHHHNAISIICSREAQDRMYRLATHTAWRQFRKDQPYIIIMMDSR